jgi:hypothetical protein
MLSLKAHLTNQDKLDVLRRADQFRSWESLDDKRVCMLCERTFTGRQVEITGSGTRTRLHCPTDGCTATQSEWTYIANPLLSDRAWQDWAAVLDVTSSKSARRAGSLSNKEAA